MTPRSSQAPRSSARAVSAKIRRTRSLDSGLFCGTYDPMPLQVESLYFLVTQLR
jgi:hypothetical protein